MGTLKQRISFIILITFIAFNCKDKPVAITSAKDVTITLEVKAKELFNLPNPNKVTIDQKCSLSDGVASSGYNGSHVSFTTEVYNTKFVYWESKLNPDPVNNGYLVEIIYIVRNGSPVILDKNVIGYISADRWEEIKSQNVDEAREALIGKRRDHLVIRDALHQFSENVKDSHEGKGFVTDDIIVERGNPVEQILKQAEEKNCDLIVMGTHGQGTLADVMMGSTARRVLRRSVKPVLVVRLPEEED